MPLPYSFILGLICLLTAEELSTDLPRTASESTLLPFLALLVVPWLVTRLAVRRRGIRPAAPRRRYAILQRLLVPAVYLVLLEAGDLRLLVQQWSGGSVLLGTVILLVPLLVMEVSVHVARRRAAADPHAAEAVANPFHLTMIAFLTLPLLLFMGALDLLSWNRELEVFVQGTAVGGMLGFAVFIVAMSVLLPVLFRHMVRTSRRVPEDARRTAAALGFPSDDVLVLETGQRMVNAALVGPLPRFRFLFLTDGLLEILDPLSIRGVVAHEVGHAKARHPLLLFTLFILVPLLLYHPAEALGLAEISETALLVGLLCALVAGLLLMRVVAHRFELEADQLSADALGGAAPCILALHKIGELFGGSRTKASFRHPSEETRIHHLLRCEGDPWYRERFVRRGRVLRGAILAGLVLALVGNAWAHRAIWPVDRLVVEFYNGRFPAVQAALEDLPYDLRPGQETFVGELREELEAARTIYPDGGAWSAIREDLAARALQRGRQVLLTDGGGAARPWFALGMIKERPTPLELSLYYYCRAEAHGSEEQVARLRDHLTSTFELDAELRRALAD